MSLLPDWKNILKHAWSAWLLIAAVLLTGLEVVLPLIDLGLPNGLYAVLMGAITSLALLARLLVQPDEIIEDFKKDESGRASKRAIGGIAGSAAAIAAAAAFIGAWEGKENTAYQDIVGVWTVCYGETKGVRPGDTYSDAECSEMLEEEIVAYEKGLDRCLTADVPIGAKIAFVSWTYNVGVGAACRSTLVRKANAGDLVGACNELPRWNRAGGKVIRGLTNRRISEREMCLESLK
jgi:GH24 family phage-related lysozyme (muramidase)